jgi:septal ring factor EnvC (AmiA/AmiB activator)
MSVEFSNAYQEILLENLMSIIKQNFMFQTQLKMFEESGKEKEELQAKYNELARAHEALKDQLSDTESIKAIADSNSSAHEEKTRLQGALNDTMKKKTALEKKIEEKNTEIESLKEYISKLEGIAPVSKLKKINPDKVVEEVKPVEQPAPDLFAIKVNDGSSF